MIDWVTAALPVNHEILCDGHFFDTCADGSIIRATRKRKQIRGSYDASVMVKTQELCNSGERGAVLFFDGNPSKFLQGHNVIGSDDLAGLMCETVSRVLSAVGQELDDISRKRILSGGFEVYRVDINYSFALSSHSDVISWLHAASVKSKTRHGKPQLMKTSLYWGKGSTVWMMKAYSKFAELTSPKTKHRLPAELVNTGLLDYSRDKLRVELQLRKELKRIARNRFEQSTFYAWMLPACNPRELFNEYLGRIEMSANVTLTDKKLAALPRKVRMTYLCWAQGVDVQNNVSRCTFYRHRAELKKFGVDIALPADTEQSASNVVPLIRPLTAQPAAIPENLQYLIYGT